MSLISDNECNIFHYSFLSSILFEKYVFLISIIIKDFFFEISVYTKLDVFIRNHEFITHRFHEIIHFILSQPNHKK